ncbi:MAG: alkaline phosphatase D family protein [Planctomyces sp.]|nr:alkaline phosphatase D family protein [Planctomyces sp.]
MADNARFHFASCNRRRFLAAGSALALWPFHRLPNCSAADRTTRLGGYPFQLGVASGDPTPDGMVLWTRLCVDPFGGAELPPEDVQVEWQVAEDEAMTHVVRKGVATAPHDWAHSVHVEVEGLKPDWTYFYQFKTGMETSPVGRTRTAPALDALRDSFRFAFASCQKFEEGHYTAYEHMLKDDLHAVVHLGDYIYEGVPKANTPRHYTGPRIKTLEDFRTRHAVYRSDPHLQAVHAAFPWLVTWDDHEVENNYAADISQYAPAVRQEEFLTLRANAYKAYYEHMPLRASALPRGPHMDLYRNVRFGRLIDISVLDTRQYRSDQPCGDGYGVPCEAVYDPQATLLGVEQEEWLKKQLLDSPCLWKVMAQQVIMAQVNFDPGTETVFSMDKWSGYDVPRRRLMQFLEDHAVRNAVTLTGDVHCNWVNDLKVDYNDPGAPTLGTEFVGTSITSRGDGAETRSTTEGMLANNPAVKFFNDERGYVRCEVTPQTWRTDFRTVEYVSRPGAPCRTRASFVVESGRPGAERA